MQRDTNDSLKELWKDEIVVRKEAQRWGILSNTGFIGLVATEIPEFITKVKSGKPAWRLPLFLASSVSIVVGVIMNLVKGNKAEKLRDTALMVEHSDSREEGKAGQPDITAVSEASPTTKWVEKQTERPEITEQSI